MTTILISTPCSSQERGCFSWFNLPLRHPVRLIQKRDDRLHELTVQRGDIIFVPAGQRVERAKLMLSKTHLTIADIALQVGFSSQSHLTQ